MLRNMQRLLIAKVSKASSEALVSQPFQVDFLNLGIEKFLFAHSKASGNKHEALMANIPS